MLNFVACRSLVVVGLIGSGLLVGLPLKAEQVKTTDSIAAPVSAARASALRTLEAHQQQYIAKYGKSFTWRGIKLTIIEPSDPHLANLNVLTAPSNGFYVLGMNVSRMDLSKVPVGMTEADLLDMTMEDLIKRSPKNNYIQVQTTLPPTNCISDHPDNVDWSSVEITIGEQKVLLGTLKLKDNTKPLTRSELLRLPKSEFFQTQCTPLMSK
jgi:hypothetical protein